MEYRKLGNSDLKISTVGLGCWAFGGSDWGEVKDEESIETIHKALDLGINFFDTAEAYGVDSHSETVVGKALEGHRDEVVLATKVSNDHLREAQVLEAVEGSLRRLRTDHIDLYQVHWPTKFVPMEETMSAMVKLLEQGKIRYIGVSNFWKDQLEEAIKYAEIVSLQPPYNIFWRFIEEDTLPFCIENNIGVIVYSPMAQGLLTGKFTKDTVMPEDDIRSKNMLFRGEIFQKCLEVVGEIKKIATKYNKTAAQTSVNWLLCQKGITSAVVGAKRISQLKENIGAADWTLSQEDIDKIEKLSHKVIDGLGRPFKMWITPKQE